MILTKYLSTSGSKMLVTLFKVGHIMSNQYALSKGACEITWVHGFFLFVEGYGFCSVQHSDV